MKSDRVPGQVEYEQANYDLNSSAIDGAAINPDALALVENHNIQQDFGDDNFELELQDEVLDREADCFVSQR